METTQISIDRWINKENVVFIYNGMLYSFYKERNPATCYNMDESWGHYVKWNKLDTKCMIPLIQSM